jgi:glycosyltransferase involved in cell wall biosynthesis
MEKIAIVAYASSPFMKKYLANLILELTQIKNIKIVLIVDEKNFSRFIDNNYDLLSIPSLDYLLDTGNPLAYEKIYDASTMNKIDSIFFPRLTHPELLYSEIVGSNRKISTRFSIFGLELFTKSGARNKLMSNLIEHTTIHSVLIHTIASSLKNPPQELAVIFNNRKVVHTNDPIYEDKDIYNLEKDFARKTLALPENKTILLYFGNAFYGKGLDIAIDSMNYLTDRFMLLIASNVMNSNYSLRHMHTNSKIKLVDKFISEEEMPFFFRACDLTILPYRKAYQYGTSGVFIQSMLAGRPVIVPNFSPFLEVINEFGVGETFMNEDPKDLAYKIKLFTKNKESMYKMKLQYYKNVKLEDWSSIVKKFYL